MLSATPLAWIGFTVFVLAMLALDLGVFQRKTHVPSVKEASAWVGVWLTLACLFGIGLSIVRGPEPALQYFAGYLIEYSLSMDNIFVFVLIFSRFAVPAAYQHRVLFWGIVGALVMRAAMIVAGATLIERFHWVIYVFGAFLIVSGIRMARSGVEEVHPERNPLLRMVRRTLPLTTDYVGARFFVWRAGRLVATPLFIVLVMVESADLVFAVDSIPAIFAVTQDPFIVYTSNVFAILGLRSLYFVLRGAVDKFYYLRHALAAILAFVGAKMLLADIFKVPTAAALLVIVGLLSLGVVASLFRSRRVSAVPHRSASEHYVGSQAPRT
jgi:tellurite resistance protein TerC